MCKHCEGINDDEFMRLRDKFMKDEFDREPQKPNTMLGTWGWYRRKEDEFIKKLQEEKKL